MLLQEPHVFESDVADFNTLDIYWSNSKGFDRVPERFFLDLIVFDLVGELPLLLVGILWVFTLQSQIAEHHQDARSALEIFAEVEYQFIVLHVAQKHIFDDSALAVETVGQ